jgi:hypothetical protein
MKVSNEMENYRELTGYFASTYGDLFGAFRVPPTAEGRRRLDIIASDGNDESGIAQGWEHVSVKVHVGIYTYTPTWDEMSWVKDQFWEPEDLVLQFHPPKSLYVNVHSNVLHLWRKATLKIELPPKELIA